MKKLLLLILCTTYLLPILAEKQQKTSILCINSYSDSFAWSNRIISQLTEYAQSDSSASLSMIYLRSITIESTDLETIKQLIKKEANEYNPTTLVLLGVTAYSLRDIYQELWGEVPIILCAMVDYIGPTQYYLENHYIPTENRIALNTLCNKYNTTTIVNPLYLKENLDLIVTTYPHISEILFIRDQLQINYDIEEELRKLLQDYHPNIYLHAVTPDKFSTIDLVTYLNSLDPNQSAILFSSWSFIQQNGSGKSISGNSRELISTCHNPIFTLSMADIIAYNGKMAIGYTNDFSDFNNQLINSLNQIISGVDARKIAPFSTPKGHPYVDYKLANKVGINLSLLPSDTIYIDAPPSFFKENFTLLFSTITIVIIILLTLYFRLQLMRIHQKELIKEQEWLISIKHKFDNMPIAYSELKLIYNKNREIIDYIYTEANNASGNYGLSLPQLLDKRASDIIPKQIFKDILQCLNRLSISNTHESTYFFWPTTKSWINSEYILSTKKDYVDNYLIDQTEIVALKEKAEASDRLKSSFLANMSHEIRTPLNAIVGFSELIQTSENNEEKEEYMKIINTNNTLLLRLIDDILDLAKIESNSIELQPETFDLVVVLKEIYETNLPKCEAKGIHLTTSLPHPICTVILDRNRMIQIAVNFLSNAIKYTKQGEIKLGYTYQENGIKLYVEDTGVGISSENQLKLFKRFEKLNSLTQGTGLGLSICKALVDNMKGEIGVESKPGKGSLFWAHLQKLWRIIVNDFTWHRYSPPYIERMIYRSPLLDLL